MTDPISDYLTRLRNAVKANHRIVEVPASNTKKKLPKYFLTKGILQTISLKKLTISREI